MSKGSTTTESVYECSRESASIQIDNTHWINQFSEGIKLNKGDQVRLLGSFIQEGANSNEIEIKTNQELNITYSPYLLGNTIDTIDKTKNGNLMDLSQIGDLAYSTDSFGIEPPMRNTTQKGEAGKYWQQVNLGDGNSKATYPLSTPYPNNTESIDAKAAGTQRGAIEAYENMADSNPAATGEQGGDVYGNFLYNPWFINGAQQGERPRYQGLVDGNTTVPQTDETWDAIRPTMRGDSAVTWGTNLITDKFNTNPTKGQTNAQTYKNFAENSVPTEMYVGHMIKKLILPQLDIFSTGNTDADPSGSLAMGNWENNSTNHTLEPLLPVAPASGEAGCLAGMPKAGMYIATVDIAESSGWFDINGNGYYENRWGGDTNNATFPGFPSYTGLPTSKLAGASGDTGKVNLKSGAQSVIGEIIAVRAIKQHILGRTTNCYEVYVSNFINPGTIDGFNPDGHLFPISSVTNAATLGVNAAPIRLYKRPHGGSSGDNGYNFNPTFNTINGAVNEVPIGQNEPWFAAGGDGAGGGTGVAGDIPKEPTQTRGYKQGQNSGTPLGYNYIQNSNTISPSPATDVATGGDASSATQEDMGLGNPEGLSFLWNGTHTGYRKTNWNYGNINRFRANSRMEPYRTGAGANPNSLRLKHLITDIIYNQSNTALNQGGGDGDDGTGSCFIRDAIIKEQGSVPTCLGAYIICNRDTMLDIAKGNLDSKTTNNFYAQSALVSPRIWFDWSFQARQSQYTTRHYVGNTWNIINPFQGRTETNGGDPGAWEERFPGRATLIEENRWGYSFMGRPNNMNWRESTVNNGVGHIGERQVQSSAFYAPAYSNWWRLTDDTGAGIDLINQSDHSPIYFNTPTGEQAALIAQRGFAGLPLVWAGYNTCCNSLYFQQKDTGDVNLGFDSWRARTSVSIDGPGVEGGQTLTLAFDLVDTDTGETRVLPNITDDKTGQYQIKVLLDNSQFNPVELITTITGGPDTNYVITLLTSTRTQVVGVGTGTTTQITHNNATWLSAIPGNASVIIYYKSSGGVGAGIDATPWSSDLIMIKENIAKYKVPAGFYTEQQLAEEVNNALHFDAETYTNEYGVKGANNTHSVPTNVGKSSYARSSQPSIVNGPFQQTYIPDVSYGFSPITTTNSVDLEQAAQTKELTSELYTYEPFINDEGTTIFTWPENMATERAYNGTTVRKITDDSTEYPTQVGKHLKVYSIPKTATSITNSDSKTKELCLMRLRGGALNQTDFPTGTDSNGRWGNVVPRMVGNMEMLRATDMAYWHFFESGSDDEYYPWQNGWWQSTAGVYMYRTRLTRNLFPNGGSSRVICGANNLTFSWEEGANRFSLNNLYTPLRPHEVENPDNVKTNDFGIGDAVPSAIISAKGNGNLITQLTGIYINDLNAPSFTRSNWGQPGLDEYWEYDILTDTQTEKSGLELLSIFGYTETQVNANINSFDIVENPFTFKSKLRKNGSAIRVGAKITPSVNSSNPTSSRCLNIAPVQQFFVQVDSDDFFAQNVPLKGDSPYYFIGSNFPSKQFYGNLNGAKLPIVGICSRNFSAFNFVFDLGGSAISFLIDENTTITHIETKIYDSQMKTPSNLSPSSSVIYLITRFNYSPNITDPQEEQNALNIMIANNQAPILNEFYSQPTANIRTELPAIIPPTNSPYFTGFGQMLPPIPEDDDDSDYDL